MACTEFCLYSCDTQGILDSDDSAEPVSGILNLEVLFLCKRDFDDLTTIIYWITHHIPFDVNKHGFFSL